MPEPLVREMVADWMGAGSAISGNWHDIENWWAKNESKVVLYEDTRKRVLELIALAVAF